jgi:hypothetical protein
MRYFTAKELVDKKTYAIMGENALSLFNPEALIALDDLREYLNTPIIVNDWHNGGTMQWRGCRLPICKEYSKGSQHAIGNAFDCTVQGYTAEQARVIICNHKDHELLRRIKRLEAGVSWLHFDLKPAAYRIQIFTI